MMQYHNYITNSYNMAHFGEWIIMKILKEWIIMKILRKPDLTLIKQQATAGAPSSGCKKNQYRLEKCHSHILIKIFGKMDLNRVHFISFLVVLLV